MTGARTTKFVCAHIFVFTERRVGTTKLPRPVRSWLPPPAARVGVQLPFRRFANGDVCGEGPVQHGRWGPVGAGGS